MKDFEACYREQENFYPDIKLILQTFCGLLDINEEGQTDKDFNEATDWSISLRAKPIESKSDKNEYAIAARVRGNEYLTFEDLAIKYPAEYQKLKGGWGDFYLYCYKNETGRYIEKWYFVDLHKVRAAGLLDKDRGKLPAGDNPMYTIPFIELRNNGCIAEESRLEDSTIIEYLKYRSDISPEIGSLSCDFCGKPIPECSGAEVLGKEYCICDTCFMLGVPLYRANGEVFTRLLNLTRRVNGQ